MDLSEIRPALPPVLRRVLCALLPLCSLLFLSGCGRIERTEQEIGMGTLANMDRFLAASRFLTAMGIPAESYRVAPALPPAEGAMIFLPASALQDEVTLGKIDDWVYEGGHVVYFLEADGEGWRWTDREVTPIDTLLEYEEIELSALSDESTADEGDIEQIYFGAGEQFREEYLTDFEASFEFRFTPSEDDDDTDYYLFDGYEHGEGSITILATGQLFTNLHLRKKEHADLLWDLVRYYNPTEVQFITSTSVSFWPLLWKSAAVAIVTAGVLLFFWVWASMRRFGPVFQAAPEEQNSLHQHLSATGSFFRQHGSDALILDELRRAHLPRLARQANLAPTSDPETILQACQQQDILTPAQCQLLSSPLPAKGPERLIFIQQLQQLIS